MEFQALIFLLRRNRIGVDAWRGKRFIANGNPDKRGHDLFYPKQD